MSIIQSLESIPLDKYLHALTSVAIFAAVHYFTRNALLAFGVANAAHVAKKAFDMSRGLRDWNDIVGDILFGTAGAALAWACLL